MERIKIDQAFLDDFKSDLIKLTKTKFKGSFSNSAQIPALNAVVSALNLCKTTGAEIYLDRAVAEGLQKTDFARELNDYFVFEKSDVNFFTSKTTRFLVAVEGALVEALENTKGLHSSAESARARQKRLNATNAALTELRAQMIISYSGLIEAGDKAPYLVFDGGSHQEADSFGAAVTVENAPRVEANSKYAFKSYETSMTATDLVRLCAQKTGVTTKGYSTSKSVANKLAELIEDQPEVMTQFTDCISEKANSFVRTGTYSATSPVFSADNMDAKSRTNYEAIINKYDENHFYGLPSIDDYMHGYKHYNNSPSKYANAIQVGKQLYATDLGDEAHFRDYVNSASFAAHLQEELARMTKKFDDLTIEEKMQRVFRTCCRKGIAKEDRINACKEFGEFLAEDGSKEAKHARKDLAKMVSMVESEGTKKEGKHLEDLREAYGVKIPYTTKEVFNKVKARTDLPAYFVPVYAPIKSTNNTFKRVVAGLLAGSILFNATAPYFAMIGKSGGKENPDEPVNPDNPDNPDKPKPPKPDNDKKGEKDYTHPSGAEVTERVGEDTKEPSNGGGKPFDVPTNPAKDKTPKPDGNVREDTGANPGANDTPNRGQDTETRAPETTTEPTPTPTPNPAETGKVPTPPETDNGGNAGIVNDPNEGGVEIGD